MASCWSGRRGSNSLPPPWQGGALPDELRPHMFQSLQATFVIITDLSQKVKGFLTFCSTFFQIFFPSRYPTRRAFPVTFFPLVLLPGPRSGFLHLHRYSYYVASYALSLHPRKQINRCFLYSLFRFFLLFKKQLDKRLCFDHSIANER